MRRTKMNRCVAGALGLLLVVLTWGQTRVLGQDRLFVDEAGRVDEAIKVLEAKALFLTTEHGVDPEFVKRFGNSVKALRRVFDTRVGEQNHARVLTGGLPAGASGAQVGPGQELDANGDPVKPGDRTKKGLGPNRILLDPPLVGENATGCNPVFISLLRNLLHEATHLNQVAGGLPADAKGLKDATETPEKATQLFDDKLRDLDNEIQAHQDEARLLVQIIDALLAIKANPANAPAWATHWKDCPRNQLDVLETAAKLIFTSKNKIIIRAKELKATYEAKRRDHPDQDAALALSLDDDDSFKEIAGDVMKDIIGLDSEDSRLRIDNSTGGTVFIETGIPHPQDVLQVQAHDGSFKLLVCGVTNFDHPQGIIRWFDMPTAGGGAVTGGGTGTMTDETGVPVGAVQYTTVVASNPFLIHPTSLVTTSDGKTYVWDVSASALYPITASHTDGVPDQVDLTRSFVRVPPAFDLRHLTTLAPVNGGLVLGWRIGSALDSGDPVVFHFRDENADGFFETVHPTRLGRLLDAAGSH